MSKGEDRNAQVTVPYHINQVDMVSYGVLEALNKRVFISKKDGGEKPS